MSDPTTILQQAGIQITAQRVAVLDAVQRNPHVTAERVTADVRTNLGSISRQSVYDTLTLLESAGIVRRIQPVGSPARFEDRVRDNHHHLICRTCGRVTDVDCAVGLAPCLTAADSHGFHIDEAEVAYWGQCPECQAKQQLHKVHLPKQQLNSGEKHDERK